MRVYSGSDIGLVRDSNQDYCQTGLFPDHVAWAVVCDGMGGANGGCTASSVATEAISQHLTEGYHPDMTSEQIRTLMEEAVEGANTEVYRMSMEDFTLRGMGTTVVCAIVRNGLVYIVHAGDSRAYLYGSGQIRRLTTDHSIVQQLVSAGRITEEEARVHPNRNIITRALGIEAGLATDYTMENFPQGSRLIICTDGLSGYFSDADLCRLIDQTGEEELIETLIRAAKSQGGSDNITVAVIAD